MSTGSFDYRMDAALRRFLASRAADTAEMPTAAQVVERIAARPMDRAKRTRRLSLAWAAIALLALLALIGLSALVAGSRRAPLPTSSNPQNGRIAVAANPWTVGGGESGDIYLVGEGSPARRIIGSDGDGVAQQCPSFSPDGRRLAYGEARASDQPVATFRGVWPVSDRAVVVVGLDDLGDSTAPISRVALPADPGEIACPEWSPDGRYLAVRNGPELWVVDAASGKSTVLPVAAAPWGQQGFAWSRDGSRIAVSEPGQIHVVRVDGGPSDLIPVTGNTPGFLQWTADGARIIYLSNDTAGDGYGGVHIVDVDGTDDTRLTREATDPGATNVDHEPVVSPDGTRLAYASITFRCSGDGCTSDPVRLLTMDLDGSNVAEIQIPSGYGVSGLQWAPDGKRLLFGSGSGVVSTAVAPGSPAIVHSQGELNLEWSGSQVTWQPVFP